MASQASQVWLAIFCSVATQALSNPFPSQKIKAQQNFLKTQHVLVSLMHVLLLTRAAIV